MTFDLYARQAVSLGAPSTFSLLPPAASPTCRAVAGVSGRARRHRDELGGECCCFRRRRRAGVGRAAGGGAAVGPGGAAGHHGRWGRTGGRVGSGRGTWRRIAWVVFTAVPFPSAFLSSQAAPAASLPPLHAPCRVSSRATPPPPRYPETRCIPWPSTPPAACWPPGPRSRGPPWWMHAAGAA